MYFTMLYLCGRIFIHLSSRKNKMIIIKNIPTGGGFKVAPYNNIVVIFS